MKHIVKQLACNGWGVRLSKITLWINETKAEKRNHAKKRKNFPHYKKDYEILSYPFTEKNYV